MYGFAYSVNGLYPNFVAHNRLPRQIVNRALLSVQNEVELDKLLHSSPIAFGFSLNGGFFINRFIYSTMKSVLISMLRIKIILVNVV